MQKAVIGMGILWFFSTLMGLAMSLFDERNTATCEKPSMQLTIHKFNGTAAQKRLGIHFPTR